MKSIHILRMERLRSINLRIGFAAAIFLAILAFNFTTKRPAPPTFEEEAYPTEVALKPFTIEQPRAKDQPPATVLKPNDLIIAVQELVVAGLLPSLIPTDTNSVIGPELGNVQPSAPIVSKPVPLPPEEPEKAHPIFVVVEEMPRFPGCEDRDLAKKVRYECATNLLLKFMKK